MTRGVRWKQTGMPILVGFLLIQRHGLSLGVPVDVIRVRDDGKGATPRNLLLEHGCQRKGRESNRWRA